MKVKKIPYSSLHQLAATDLAYIQQDKALEPFYKYSPSLSNIPKLIAAKQFSSSQRAILCEVLEAQYLGIKTEALLRQNLSYLTQEDCYTVCTAHQPCLMTGPLYFIYKIVDCIRLCKDLTEEYPAYRFVPVYWMGSEDHDFEEINHFYLYGKKISWQDAQGGSVGNYKIESLLAVIEELEQILGSSQNANWVIQQLKEIYQNSSTYAEFMFQWVNLLFGQYGLVILQPEYPPFKESMQAIFKDDLWNHSSKLLIEKTIDELAEKGFKNQAHVREINLFYKAKNLRERIVRTEKGFEVLNSSIRFSEEEMLAELQKHPEHFSPNVILRPLFQELILPNIVFIGGGGEIAYWLERMSQFEHYKIPFPMLLRRNSAMWFDKSNQEKMRKLEVELPDLFLNKHSLLRKYVEERTEEALSFEQEKSSIQNIFKEIAYKTSAVDASLEASVAAQEAQIINALEKLETRLLRSEKKRHEIALQQLEKLQDKLFPDGGLQERKDNFLAFFVEHGFLFFEHLIAHLDPFDKHFLVFEEQI